METLNQKIEKHYFRQGLLESILIQLEAQGDDNSNIKRSALSKVDEFHVRGAEVSKELADAHNIRGAYLLDVGSGLGGPCRMLADEYDCQCIGIDLSSEFVRTATALSKLLALDHQTTFIQGAATNLPFQKETFDVVWTQHVQMNIPDKTTLYSEIERVLKPGGFFLYYDIFVDGGDEVKYPMPWADQANQSFLFGTKEMHEIMAGLGMRKMTETNQTQAGVEFFARQFDKIIKTTGPPEFGLNLLMGDMTQTKLKNLFKHLKNGVLLLQSGSFEKVKEPQS